jgi:hypothetical protein
MINTKIKRSFIIATGCFYPNFFVPCWSFTAVDIAPSDGQHRTNSMFLLGGFLVMEMVRFS